MKIEIDLANKSELRRQRQELTKYLELIELALKEDSANNGTPQLSFQNDIPINEGVSTVAKLIDSLPSEFSSSDIYSQTNDKVSRSAVKLALAQAIKDGKIKETQKGIGRRPSQYKKI